MKPNINFTEIKLKIMKRTQRRRTMASYGLGIRMLISMRSVAPCLLFLLCFKNIDSCVDEREIICGTECAVFLRVTPFIHYEHHGRGEDRALCQR